MTTYRIQYNSDNSEAVLSDPSVPTAPPAAEQNVSPYARIMDATAQNAMLKRQSDAMQHPGRLEDDKREFAAKIEQYNQTLEIQESLVAGGRMAEARRYREIQQHRAHDLGILCARLGIDFNSL